MDDEQTFWIRLWALAAVVTVVVALLITTYNIDKNNIRGALAIKGIDPLTITCVLDSNSTDAKCLVLAVQGKK